MATILPWYSRKAAQDFQINGINSQPNVKVMFQLQHIVQEFNSIFIKISSSGCDIKKGWAVNLDVVSIHHDPENFRDPEKFDPSRFDVSTSQLINFTSIPFY